MTDRPGSSRKLWMSVAFVSVLIVGLAAGLVADRLLTGHGAAGRGREDLAPQRDGRSSKIRFDCRDRDEGLAAAAAASSPDTTPADDAMSEAFDRRRSSLTRRMARRLELDAQQVELLEPIVGEAMARSRRYWTEAREEFCAMQRDFHQQVGELLRPDQTALLDDMRRDLLEWPRRDEDGDRRREERRRHEEREPPGGRP